MLEDFLNALKDLAQSIWDQLKVLKHLPSLESFSDFWKHSLTDPKAFGLIAGGLVLLTFLVYKLRRNQTIKRRRMMELTEALEDDGDYSAAIIDNQTREDPLISELKSQLELPEPPSEFVQMEENAEGFYEEDLPSEFFEDLDGLKEEVSANPEKFEEIEPQEETISAPPHATEKNVLTFEATPEIEGAQPSLEEAKEESDIDLEFEKLEQELLDNEEAQEIIPLESFPDSPTPPVVKTESTPTEAATPAPEITQEDLAYEKPEEIPSLKSPKTEAKPEPFLLPLEAIIEEPAPEPVPKPLTEISAGPLSEPSPEEAADPSQEPILKAEPLPDLPETGFSPEEDSLPTLQTLENLQNEIDKTIKSLAEDNDTFKEEDKADEPVVSYRDPERIIQKLEAFGENLEDKIKSLSTPSSVENKILIDAQSPIAKIPSPPKKAVTMEVLESFLFIPKNKESDS